MTTRVLLIRHGAHDLLGRVLCGRAVDVRLNETGRAQAELLAATLADHGITSVQTSPMGRAAETAAPLAGRLGLGAVRTPALDEIDFGAWAGLAFATLEGTRPWQDWNGARSRHRPPGGESMLEVQGRLAAWIDAMARAHDGGAVAAFTHADVIKAVVCHTLGLPIDQHARFDIDPASTTTLVVGDWGARLVGLNVPRRVTGRGIAAA